MSADSCPTVTVKGQDGNALIINQTDFDADPAVWELFNAPTAPAAPVVDPVATTSVPSKMLVTKEGKGAAVRYFVTDAADKSKVLGVVGIDETGYADEGSAWAAIMAATTAGQ